MLNLNNINKEFKKQQEGIPNYVSLLGLSIKSELGEAAFNNFINDSMISSCVDYNGLYQRFFINRYFLYILSKFTYLTNISSLNEVYLLVNDGELEDWFKIINTIILPYLKNNNVLEKVYQI